MDKIKKRGDLVLTKGESLDAVELSTKLQIPRIKIF